MFGCVPKAAVPSPTAHTITIVPYTDVKAKNTPAKPHRFKVKINALGCDEDAVSEHVLSASFGIMWLIVGFFVPSFRC